MRSVRSRWTHVLRIAVALLAVSAVLGLAPAGAQATDPAVLEVRFLRALNEERVRAGITPLVRDTGLDGVAREWSAAMDAVDRLSHRPDLARRIAGVEPRWRRGGENVGVGGSVESLHQAFMNSPGHRANVLGQWNRVGVGVVVDGPIIWVTFNFLDGPTIVGATGLEPTPPADTTVPPGPPPEGDFWLVTDDGTVRAFGRARHVGDASDLKLNRPIVGMAPTPSGNGYWLVASDGGVFTYGDAGFYGSTGGMRLNRPIVGMAATPTGRGYWLVASDGGVFTFGDAGFHGSAGSLPLNAPVNGIAATASGKGYWLVAADGGVFSYGDAVFRGSTGGRVLPAPINGIATTPSGLGYWLVGADGTVFAFGDARHFGSADSGGVPLSRIAPLPDGSGYRMVAADGRVFSFDASGSKVSGGQRLGRPIVAMANR